MSDLQSLSSRSKRRNSFDRNVSDLQSLSSRSRQQNIIDHVPFEEGPPQDLATQVEGNEKKVKLPSLSSRSRQRKSIEHVSFDESPSQAIPTQIGFFSVSEEAPALENDVIIKPEPVSFGAMIRAKAGDLVNNKNFQIAIIVLIFMNAVTMGLGTVSFIKDDPEKFALFEWVDMGFLIIFTLELLVQFTYHGYHLFFDGWLVFDFVIVVLSWGLRHVQIIRAFRVFRTLRLITRIKLLQNLVSAIISVIPRLFAIVCLMALIFYIFSVMFTQLFRNKVYRRDYFGTLQDTALTLFELMTLEWSGIAREVMEDNFAYWIPVVFFIITSSFITLNMVVAVICDCVFMLRSTLELKGFDSKKEVAILSNQVADARQVQEGIQERLEDLVLLLGDVGAVGVH